jgi:predicted ATPase/transcriptional regulator with XRE-family HTH domain
VAVNEPSASFGDLLRKRRRAAGLTQEQLAERAGVSPRSISEMERGGAHLPRRDTVGLLARALGLAGPEREAFEGLVERIRRPRPRLGRATIDRAPPSTEHGFDRARHNLPRSLSSFVGREQELTELAQLLPTTPLLTLVGAGGVGKTRLAQELVRDQVARYVDGCWLVELAGLADASLIPGAIAATVDLRDIHARNVTNTLAEYLRSKQLLLVLDNCEHLVQACAELVARLLHTCPRLQVLATSREPLAIDGETTWRVQPLELPDLQQPQSAEQITRSAAVRLFIERARAVNSAFVLTDDNLSVIARICIGVDGIPLALELAAARARVLTVEQLAERLEYDSGVLGRGTRAGQPQHRTIRATLDWSHDLLGQEERILLRRLAVFVGWTLQLSEAVCSGAGIEPASVLDLVTQLVDKSMVQVNGTDVVARYRLLEPIRQYALERLEASGEATAYRARHAAALLEFAQIGPDDPAGPDEIPSVDRVEVEHDNIRAALRWALNHQDVATSLRASAALFRFWERRGHFQEGRAWLEEALALPGVSDAAASERSRALNALANLCFRGGDADRAQPIAEQALAASQEDGNPRGIAWALMNLGMTAYLRHQHEQAVAYLEQSVPFARRAGHVPLLSLALAFLGRTRLWVHGPRDRHASEALKESLALAQMAQSRYAAGHALATLGDLLWGQGEVDRAIRLWRRALRVVSELADRRGIAGCLERLALVLAASDRLESAAWLFGAAEAQHKVLGMELRHDKDGDHAHFVAVTREHLGDAFAPAWSAGRESTLDEAISRGLEATRGLPRGSVTLRRDQSTIAPAHSA